jgi:uncharacterized protein (TIGR03118 family)
MRLHFALLLCLITAARSVPAQDVAARATPYTQTNIVSNVKGLAPQFNPHLTNASGIAYLPGQPFFIADNLAGNIRVLDPAGFSESPGILLVAPPAGVDRPSNPTAIVTNQSSGFELDTVPSRYIFATEDGTISAWSEIDGDFLTMTSLALDRSREGAEYEGLVILTNSCCEPVLAATDFHHGFVQCVSGSFVPFACPERFIDPKLPAHYAPFGINQIGNQVFVTYALHDDEKLHAVPGAGEGIVDVFDWEGRFLKRFATGGTLNAPWAVIKASAAFGTYADDILIGNFGDGTISALDARTGQFRGQLKDKAGKVIANPGLRGLVFGSPGTGAIDTLYFTAGPAGKAEGLLGSLTPAPADIF